jgi:hypothetical protein
MGDLCVLAGGGIDPRMESGRRSKLGDRIQDEFDDGARQRLALAVQLAHGERGASQGNGGGARIFRSLG